MNVPKNWRACLADSRSRARRASTPAKCCSSRVASKKRAVRRRRPDAQRASVKISAVLGRLRALVRRAAGLVAMPVQGHGVIAEYVPQPLGDRLLALLDRLVDELFDPAAVKTHDMVVMRPLVQLENRHAV